MTINYFVLSLSRPVDQLAPLLDELCGGVLLVQELLEPQEGEEPGAEGEVGGEGEHQQQRREVDVEAVLDDGDHVHVSHDPGVGGGRAEAGEHVAVHVHHRQEVQTQRRRDAAQQRAREQERVAADRRVGDA